MVFVEKVFMTTNDKSTRMKGWTNLSFYWEFMMAFTNTGQLPGNSPVNIKEKEVMSV